MTSRKYHVDPKTGNMGVCRARRGIAHSEARMERRIIMTMKPKPKPYRSSSTPRMPRDLP